MNWRHTLKNDFKTAPWVLLFHNYFLAFPWWNLTHNISGMLYVIDDAANKNASKLEA